MRNKPTPSAPFFIASRASAAPPMLATISTRCPSWVIAGSAAFACAAMRDFSPAAFFDFASAISASLGLSVSSPSSPFKIICMPLSKPSTSTPALTTAGRLNARAMIAVWEVGPPLAVQKPSTLSRSSEAVSEGERSSATTITG